MFVSLPASFPSRSTESRVHEESASPTTMDVSSLFCLDMYSLVMLFSYSRHGDDRKTSRLCTLRSLLSGYADAQGEQDGSRGSRQCLGDHDSCGEGGLLQFVGNLNSSGCHGYPNEPDARSARPSARAPPPATDEETSSPHSQYRRSLRVREKYAS